MEAARLETMDGAAITKVCEQSTVTPGQTVARVDTPQRGRMSFSQTVTETKWKVRGQRFTQGARVIPVSESDESGHRRRTEQILQAEAEGRPHSCPADELGGEEGVSAEVEE